MVYAYVHLCICIYIYIYTGVLSRYIKSYTDRGVLEQHFG